MLFIVRLLIQTMFEDSFQFFLYLAVLPVVCGSLCFGTKAAQEESDQRKNVIEDMDTET